MKRVLYQLSVGVPLDAMDQFEDWLSQAAEYVSSQWDTTHKRYNYLTFPMDGRYDRRIVDTTPGKAGDDE